MCSVKCVVRIVECAVCSVQCSVFSVQCVVFSVKCEVCIVQCAVQYLARAIGQYSCQRGSRQSTGYMFPMSVVHCFHSRVLFRGITMTKTKTCKLVFT